MNNFAITAASVLTEAGFSLQNNNFVAVLFAALAELIGDTEPNDASADYADLKFIQNKCLFYTTLDNVSKCQVNSRLIETFYFG